MTPGLAALLTISLVFAPLPVRSQSARDHPKVAGVQRVKTPPEEFRCDAAAPLRAPLYVGRNTQKSKLLSSVQPAYPPSSKGAGKIRLEATINEDGAVYSIRFLDCPESLKQTVRAAVCQWRYEPTYLNESISHEGRRVGVVAVIELSYTFARYRM